MPGFQEMVTGLEHMEGWFSIGKAWLAVGEQNPLFSFIRGAIEKMESDPPRNSSQAEK